MYFRLTAVALAAVLALGAAKKNVATSKAENEDLSARSASPSDRPARLRRRKCCSRVAV